MGRHTCATIVALAFFCVVCGHAAASPGTIKFGVADDTGKYATDSGAEFYARISASGLGNDRLTVMWDPANPMTITEQPFLDRTIPEAASHRGEPHPVGAACARKCDRRKSRAGEAVRGVRRAPRNDLSDGQDVRDRERAEPAALLAAAVPQRETGRGARLRTGARPLLRRVEEGRSDDHGRRRRALGTRERRCARTEQPLDVTAAVSLRPRCRVSREQAQGSADGPLRVSSVPTLVARLAQERASSGRWRATRTSIG